MLWSRYSCDSFFQSWCVLSMIMLLSFSAVYLFDDSKRRQSSPFEPAREFLCGSQIIINWFKLLSRFSYINKIFVNNILSNWGWDLYTCISKLKHVSCELHFVQEREGEGLSEKNNFPFFYKLEVSVWISFLKRVKRCKILESKIRIEIS